MDFAITAELVAPITEAISSGLTTLIPIGIGIMATFIGISLIPRIIYKFLYCSLLHHQTFISVYSVIGFPLSNEYTIFPMNSFSFFISLTHQYFLIPLNIYP